MHRDDYCYCCIDTSRFWAVKRWNVRIVYYVILIITRTFSVARFLFPSSRKSSFASWRILFLYPHSFNVTPGAISLVRYAWYMQTYVLFQYSILRNIVSKTSESLIRRVINLAFRFVYISHPVAVYTPYVIYVYTAQCSLPFQYSLNNVSSINSITLSASRCCSLSNQNISFYNIIIFTVK